MPPACRPRIVPVRFRESFCLPRPIDSFQTVTVRLHDKSLEELIITIVFALVVLRLLHEYQPILRFL